MKYEKSLKHFLSAPLDMLLPSVVVDCVIISFSEGRIKILLNRYKMHERWMLPGGYVYKTEAIDEAAYRLLKKRTSLNSCYLQQFYTFGEIDRKNIEENRLLLDENGLAGLDSHWMLNRYVSIGYYALVNYNDVKIEPSSDEYCEWFDLDNIPVLYGNHQKIIDMAIQSLRFGINHIPIGLGLLPAKFTIGELRVVYETILKKKLDRRNFQRKILSYEYICKLDEKNKKWGVKEAVLYSFNKEKYIKALEQGIAFF
ncbi:MAG: NUDIX domain-containing protein [Prevotella sp.]|jgi:hypothetical protein|nr:NUDIX domain-containing protein [Prevotella sp.]